MDQTIRLSLPEPYEEFWIEFRNPRRMRRGAVKQLLITIDNARHRLNKARHHLQDGKGMSDSLQATEQIEQELLGLVVGWNLTDAETGEVLDPTAPGVFDRISQELYEACLTPFTQIIDTIRGGQDEQKNSKSGSSSI